ncbi:LuxR C-terminal-related transcriptional regulator [Saccharopolyspora pogona]|uniref:LuxR C-terminal-related transcriptional regulator n=1 Tax=Saccharopolyspora pogona TaxID=333966 RepID=UPI001CC23CD7|nr:LuxR C-terminal-related transcriptional regulator [Saccharopolyspora pogona]
MAELKQKLSCSRIVTLTGAGGVGKSRLATHVAWTLRRAFPDGVHLVELGKVRDPSLVPQTVVNTLGIQDRSMRDPSTVLVDYLSARRALLVLDNCEHLLDACAHLTATLASAAPGLRVLATSREPLRVAGEHVWPVPALSVPPPEWSDLPPGSAAKTPAKQYEALTLFEQRGAAVSPGFRLGPDNEAYVARLCQQLDGVPLAIELAAACMRMLTVEQILERLTKRFSLLTAGDRAGQMRHHTLRAAVDWSFELCTEQERLLWARGSVFVGEFDLDAVEYICADEMFPPEEVFTALMGLIAKSIVSRIVDDQDYHYRMLETIRQYGHERLAESGDEDNLRCRHRDYYLRLAEQCDSECSGSNQAHWIRRLRAERFNIWVALDFCATTPGEARTGLHMASALCFMWTAGGFLRSGRHWLDRMLSLNTEPTHERIRALWINGWLAHLQGDYASSVALLDESRELALLCNDDVGLTYAIQFLGDTENWHNNAERALPLLEEALERHRASGQWNAIALQIFPLRIHTAHLLGKTDCATELLRECQALCAPLGECWTLSWTEWSAAIARWAAGDLEKASEYLRESLRKKGELNEWLGIACCLSLLACVAAAGGDAHRAAVLFGASDTMWELADRMLYGIEKLLDWVRHSTQLSRKALGKKAFEAAYQQGERMTQEEVIAYALGDKRPHQASTAAAAPAPLLTKRELEVVALIAAGMSNKQIAASLVISQRTAESHVENILTKMGLTSRTQIAAWHSQQKDSP